MDHRQQFIQWLVDEVKAVVKPDSVRVWQSSEWVTAVTVERGGVGDTKYFPNDVIDGYQHPLAIAQQEAAEWLGHFNRAGHQ